ncbi:MAG: hypothetical protein NUW02_00265 [Candidatus Campbellbacteria bacterium]|nr:hypothetical protein [Candidatus Campbellbacteria bacterium]
MAKNSVHGVLVTMFLGVEMFLVINLILALRAHRGNKSRAEKQVVFVYTLWVILWSSNLTLFFAKGGLNEWSRVDSAIAVALCLGIFGLWVFAHIKKLSSSDGIMRGCLSLLFKVTPQIGQAIKIAIVGGAPGIGIIMIVVGHMTILTRMAQLFVAARRGWSRELRGLVLSEMGNEVSWLAVTILWTVL